MWVTTGHRVLCSTLGERRRGFLKGCSMGISVSLGFWSVHFCVLCTSNSWFFTELFWRSAAPKRENCTWLGELGWHQLPPGVCWSQEPEGPSKPPKSDSLLCWWPSRHSAEDVPCNSKCRARKVVRTLSLAPFLSWPDIVVKLESSFWAITRDALSRGEFYSLLAWPEILSTTITSSTEVPEVPSPIALLSDNTSQLSWSLESVPICRAKIENVEALQMVMIAWGFFVLFFCKIQLVIIQK